MENQIVNESLNEFDEYQNRLDCFERIVSKLKVHGINYVGYDDEENPILEKDGHEITQNLMTWQAAASSDSDITEDIIVEWLVEGFKKYENGKEI